MRRDWDGSVRLLMAACSAAAAVLSAVVPVGVTAATPTPVIQPGSLLTTTEFGCGAADWVFQGQGRLRKQEFIGTDSLCLRAVGQRVYLNKSLTSVELGTYVGTVAYISPMGYALIRFDRHVLTYVNPAMAGNPHVPQRLGTTANVKPGDLCDFGARPVRYDPYGVSQAVPLPAGVLADFSNARLFCDGGPDVALDHGGPMADNTAGNAALGIATDTNGRPGTTEAPLAGVGGLTVVAMLADAARHGFPIKLRTVA